MGVLFSHSAKKKKWPHDLVTKLIPPYGVPRRVERQGLYYGSSSRPERYRNQGCCKIYLFERLCDIF